MMMNGIETFIFAVSLIVIFVLFPLIDGGWQVKPYTFVIVHLTLAEFLLLAGLVVFVLTRQTWSLYMVLAFNFYAILSFINWIKKTPQQK